MALRVEAPSGRLQTPGRRSSTPFLQSGSRVLSAVGSGVVPVLAAGRLLVNERALTGQGRAELATLLQTAAARAATPA